MTTAAPSPYKLTFPRLLRSEAIKLTTLRSPWWSAAIVVVLSVGISLLMASAMKNVPDGVMLGSLGVSVVLGPTSFTMLLAVIIGAMQSSGEYSTGMILASTTAAPGRIGNVVAKSINVAVFVFIVSIVSFLIAAVVTAPILGERAMDWADPAQSIIPLLIGALAMAVFALIGVACGYLLRSPAGAIAVSIGVVFVLPIIPGLFSFNPDFEWIAELAKFLPSNAFQNLVLGADDGKPLAAVVLAAWALVPLALAAVVVKRRDA